MGTRGTIRFKDGDEEYFVYSGHDSYPENTTPFIEAVVEKKKGCWSGAECGLLVSCFLGENYEPNHRITPYMMTTGFHGDEIYRYFVDWDKDSKAWIVSVGK